MFKYTSNTLEKLENLLESIGYKVRYEKGNFKSGYCLINEKKVAIVNKFFAQEARINTLVEMLGTIEVNITMLDVKQQTLYLQVIHQHEVKNKSQQAA